MSLDPFAIENQKKQRASVRRDSEAQVPLNLETVSIEKIEENKRIVAVRNYQVWPGNHKFRCRGRCFQGPKFKKFTYTAIFMNLVNSEVLRFAVRNLFKKGSEQPLKFVFPVYFVSNVLLASTAFVDPGFVPRQKQNKQSRLRDLNKSTLVLGGTQKANLI